MSFYGSMSSKGQVTIPQEIRKRLGLRKGDSLEFLIEGNRTIMRPARSPENCFSKFAGILDTFKSEKEINAWVSEMRGE